MRRAQGVTLIELLIAMVVFGVIIALLGQVFVGATRSYNVNAEVSEERQVVQTIEELLRYEISLAGYRCADGSVLSSARQFTSDPVQIGTSGGFDTIRVQYFEEQSGSCTLVPRDVTFSISDGDLMRADGSGTASIVGGVVGMEVLYWLSDFNAQFVVQGRPVDEALAGMGIRVDLEDGTSHVVTVGFRNPQCPNLNNCL